MYAYDTTYAWDDKLQKKVQKKVCIGKFDPTTGEIIPNAQRGRPAKKSVINENLIEHERNRTNEAIADDFEAIINDICLELAAFSERTEKLLEKMIKLRETVSKPGHQ